MKTRFFIGHPFGLLQNWIIQDCVPTTAEFHPVATGKSKHLKTHLENQNLKYTTVCPRCGLGTKYFAFTLLYLTSIRHRVLHGDASSTPHKEPTPLCTRAIRCTHLTTYWPLADKRCKVIIDHSIFRRSLISGDSLLLSCGSVRVSVWQWQPFQWLYSAGVPVRLLRRPRAHQPSRRHKDGMPALQSNGSHQWGWMRLSSEFHVCFTTGSTWVAEKVRRSML